MMAQTNFRCSAQSTILTPDSQGLVALVRHVKSGGSIVARPSASAPISARKEDEPFLFCETSGSSGRAKTVKRRPMSWIRSFNVNAETYGIKSDDNYAVLGDLGHSISLYAALEALHIGADIAELAGVLPRTQAHKLADLTINVIYATPTQLRLLIAGAKSAGVTTLPRVRTIFSGGGKLDNALLQGLKKVFPQAAIREFFGASETSFVTISDSKTPQGSVGKPYPNVQIRIGAEDANQPHEAGEIWVSSPYLFEGYQDGTAHDTVWDGNFLSIGEIGYLDSDGYLFLRGRKNRMVTVADRNVFPEEIEREILEEPGIDFCAALALKDEKRGNKIICAIQTAKNEGIQKTLRERCRKNLGAQAVPHRFVFLDQMPLLPAGKPDLQTLQNMLGTLV